MTAVRGRKLLDGIHDQEPVSGLTHNFYRYPARFSPNFARAIIEAFTKPGDLVYDPFVGGGTTLVEASALGRAAVGTDVSSLAVFIARAKTTLMTRRRLANVWSWVDALIPFLNVHAPAIRSQKWIQHGYQRNLDTPSTWRIRKLLEIAVDSTSLLQSHREQQFARCILLKTAQWALDCRSEIPTVKDFRAQLGMNAQEMISAAANYAKAVAGSRSHVEPVCLHRSAIGIEDDARFPTKCPVSLVLTSPPYPGVHVLYHRWQIQGRKETPAPFWIASTMDGTGASFYTFGDRQQRDLVSYYDQAVLAFKSIARIATRATTIVQMIAFSDPSSQLPRYLDSMEEAGFVEVPKPGLANGIDKRAWRSIPNRKWYANQKGAIGASKEVVLFHRLRH